MTSSFSGVTCDHRNCQKVFLLAVSVIMCSRAQVLDELPAHSPRPLLVATLAQHIVTFCGALRCPGSSGLNKIAKSDTESCGLALNVHDCVSLSAIKKLAALTETRFNPSRGGPTRRATHR